MLPSSKFPLHLYLLSNSLCSQLFFSHFHHLFPPSEFLCLKLLPFLTFLSPQPPILFQGDPQPQTNKPNRPSIFSTSEKGFLSIGILKICICFYRVNLWQWHRLHKDCFLWKSTNIYVAWPCIYTKRAFSLKPHFLENAPQDR